VTRAAMKREHYKEFFSTLLGVSVCGYPKTRRLSWPSSLL
jgi:hypothetical protein